MFEFEETKNSIDYMKVYLKEEKIILEDLISIFNNLSHFYNSNNSSKLNNLILELTTSLKQVDKNLSSNINIIESTVLNYEKDKEETKKRVIDILEDTNIKSID